MNLPIKIASRRSPLALAQVEEVIQSLKLRGIEVTYEAICLWVKTWGSLYAKVL